MSLTPYRKADMPEYRPILPKLPNALNAVYCAVESGAGYQPSYSNLIHAQIETALVLLTPLLTPVTDKHLLDWLLPIPAVVRNGGRGEAETKAWFAGVCLACAGLPASLFNRATQAEALRTFQFFPSAADIYQLVAADKAKLAARAMILRKMLDTPTEEL